MVSLCVYLPYACILSIISYSLSFFRHAKEKRELSVLFPILEITIQIAFNFE